MFEHFEDANILHSWTTMAGYPAIVVGQLDGYRCGYVQLPESHPAVGKYYGALDIAVHGGLTYGEGGVFGFDCAHFLDAKDESIMSEECKEYYKQYHDPNFKGVTIKTTEFCIAECESMAQQFKELENEPNNI